jgi:hypothetical protein
VDNSANRALEDDAAAAAAAAAGGGGQTATTGAGPTARLGDPLGLLEIPLDGTFQVQPQRLSDGSLTAL